MESPVATRTEAQKARRRLNRDHENAQARARFARMTAAQKARHRERKRLWSRGWRAANPVKARSWYERQLEEMVRMAGRPKPRICECCGSSSQFIVWDHYQKTGSFRGWICSHCNLAIGHMKDDPEVADFVASYLRGLSPRRMAEASP